MSDTIRGLADYLFKKEEPRSEEFLQELENCCMQVYFVATKERRPAI